MSNIGIDAPAAHPLGPGPGRPAAAYHPQFHTDHLYGGDFFTPWAIPGAPPMPGSHSP